MGRPRKSNPLNLPSRVYAKHGAFYYHHPGGKWERIGTDVEQAKRRASEIKNNLTDGFGQLPYWYDEFLAHCKLRVSLGDLAPRTLSDYTEAGERLKAYFADFYPMGIEPSHVGDYLDLGLKLGRGVRANREKAALSVMFSWLIRKGFGGVKTNPCAGIRRNKETKRERYVEDDEMQATLEIAPIQVWGLAQLVYRTLQRPEDVITWTQHNIVERRDHTGRAVKIIRNKQGKTGAIVDIEVSAEIQSILDKLKAAPMTRKKPSQALVVGMTLIHRLDGKPYTYDGLSAMLKRCQVAVREQHQKDEGPLAQMPPWGFYDMKGKGATDMWLHGERLERIQVLCAHDSVTTTEKYVKSRWRGIVSPNQVSKRV